MDKDQIADALEAVANVWKAHCLKLEQRIAELELKLGEAHMDIDSLERKIDSMRDTQIFNGNPD
jgi:predicted RNase H-like nuclease (RuvC/YqgF family)